MVRKLLIQQLLIKMNVTPSELARITFIDKSVISRWLQGVGMNNGSVYQLKYYCDKHLSKEVSNNLFGIIIREIEKG